MSPITQNQWNSFLQALLSQFNSNYGQQRINCFSRLPYFFEDWLKGECAVVASSVFANSRIFINEMFQGIQNLDMGLDVGGNLCALELKHIATGSRDAKSRFLGPKSSNAVQDFLKLYNFNPRNHILCKLLFLYGPTQLTHNQGPSCQRSKQGLNRICLKCAMDLFIQRIIQRIGIQNVNWQCHRLQINQMYIVEVDI